MLDELSSDGSSLSVDEKSRATFNNACTSQAVLAADG